MASRFNALIAVLSALALARFASCQCVSQLTPSECLFVFDATDSADCLSKVQDLTAGGTGCNAYAMLELETNLACVLKKENCFLGDFTFTDGSTLDPCSDTIINGADALTYKCSNAFSATLVRMLQEAPAPGAPPAGGPTSTIDFVGFCNYQGSACGIISHDPAQPNADEACRNTMISTLIGTKTDCSSWSFASSGNSCYMQYLNDDSSCTYTNTFVDRVNAVDTTDDIKDNGQCDSALLPPPTLEFTSACDAPSFTQPPPNAPYPSWPPTGSAQANGYASQFAPPPPPIAQECQALQATTVQDMRFSIVADNRSTLASFSSSTSYMTLINGNWTGSPSQCCQECCKAKSCNKAVYNGGSCIMYLYDTPTVPQEGAITFVTCGGQSPVSPSPDAAKAGIIAGVIVGALALIGVIVAIIWRWKRRPPPAAPADKDAISDSSHDYHGAAKPALDKATPSENRVNTAPEVIVEAVNLELPTPPVGRPVTQPVTQGSPSKGDSAQTASTEVAKVDSVSSAKLASRTQTSSNSLAPPLTSTLGTLSSTIVTAGGLDNGDPIRALTQQLDAMHAQGTLLARRYRLLGRVEQRSGAQGVVRFATLANNPARQFAAKFFLDRRNFDLEQALYSDPALIDLLAPTEDISSNEHEPPILGRPLPPMIVTERGESLDDYARRRQPDFFMCLPIVGHLAQRVERIHAASLVHRDLKPANVMWLPSENGFTVIDFGSAARDGADAPISCTLAYAAPEAVAAYAAGESRMRVASALDVWSLGVLFYEFLTGTRVLECGREGIVARATEQEPYRWEQRGTPQHDADMRRLGFLRPLILAMLSRDPASRISMAEFSSQLKQMMQRETTAHAG